MTATINNTTAVTELQKDGKVKLTVAGKTVGTYEADEITAIVTALLAGRKAAYDAKRTAKQAERTAKQAERDAKKAEQIKKLQERLEKLQKAQAA